MRFGYARVSKAEEQDPAAQVRALREAGCERVFEERAARLGLGIGAHPVEALEREVCRDLGVVGD